MYVNQKEVYYYRQKILWWVPHPVCQIEVSRFLEGALTSDNAYYVNFSLFCVYKWRIMQLDALMIQCNMDSDTDRALACLCFRYREHSVKRQTVRLDALCLLDLSLSDCLTL